MIVIGIHTIVRNSFCIHHIWKLIDIRDLRKNNSKSNKYTIRIIIVLFSKAGAIVCATSGAVIVSRHINAHSVGASVKHNAVSK